MKHATRNFTFRFLLLAGATAGIGIPLAARADTSLQNLPLQQPSAKQDLVYILTKSGLYQDVTKSLFQYQGNTYCVCDGVTCLIIPNYDTQTVQDANGNTIGYTAPGETSN